MDAARSYFICICEREGERCRLHNRLITWHFNRQCCCNLFFHHSPSKFVIVRVLVSASRQLRVSAQAKALTFRQLRGRNTTRFPVIEISQNPADRWQIADSSRAGAAGCFAPTFFLRKFTRASSILLVVLNRG